VPRKRTGFTRFDLELPDDILAAALADAKARGEPVSVYVIRAVARRAGVKGTYTPRPVGRPKKEKK
jgi:hypothetical protein